MVGVELSGGLGNQFFRYAFARKLIYDRGEKELLIINKKLCHHHGAEGDIESFNIYSHHRTCLCRRLVLKYGFFSQKILYSIYVFVKKLFEFFKTDIPNVRFYLIGLMRSKGVLVVNDPTNLACMPSNGSDRIFAMGNFENSKYFYTIRDVLLEEFSPKFAILKKKRRIL